MKDFEGKAVLITGGTSGIGRAAAVAFASRGASVAFTGRREQEGNETLRLVREAGGRALFLKGDVSLESDVSRWVAETVKAFGRLDIAFNNAGIEEAGGPLVEKSGEQCDRILAVNVKGVLFSMKHEIPAMLKTGGGSIINTASIAGSIGMAGVPVYVASKHAVIGLTRSTALEFAKQNIRINSVSPAAIETEMYDRFADSPDKRQFLASLHPIGRTGRAEEVVSAVLYLASPGASFVTGSDLRIDGGFTAA